MGMRNPTTFLGLTLLLAAPACLMAANSQDFKEGGMALYRAGQYAKALDYFNNAVQADPNDWQAYEDLGDTYSKMDDLANAKNAYQKSLQIHPNNPTVQVLLDNLDDGAAETSPSTTQDNSNFNNLSQDHPALAQPTPSTDQMGNDDSQTVIIRRRGRFRRRPVYEPLPVNYKDGLNPIDHARIWTKLELGYSYSQLGELTNAADNLNSGAYVNADPGLPIAYTGNSLASNSGLHLGAELGFLLNPNMGIAFGIKGIAMNDFTANVAYQDSFNDFEDERLSPYLVPMTMDFYFFLPDAGGRFYLKAGAGYYLGSIHLDETYNYSNFYNQHESTATENWIGDLYSGNVGFQLGIGREFAISRRFGIELYAEGRYAKITNFRGTLTDQDGNTVDAALVTGANKGVVDFDTPSSVGSANGENYTTLDFTGFDVGFSLNFYSY